MRLHARHVALALSVVVVIAFTVGTGGFSSMTADRGVSIAVADDENAYLGIETDEPDAVRANALANEDGRETTLLTLTNRFSSAVTIDARVPDAGDGLAITDIETLTLSGGDSGTMAATVTCDTPVDREVTVEINASGTGIEVKTDEQIAVDCAPAATTTPPANGTTEDTTATSTETNRTAGDAPTTEAESTTATVPTTRNEPTTDVTPTSTAADERTNTSSS